MGLGCIGSYVDSSSVYIPLSMNDGRLQDIIEQFHYFEWKKPNSSIRPFEPHPLNLKDSQILKYRVGFLPHGLVWRTYYEAQYLLPDGSKFTGPALGPLPPTVPNIIVSVILVVPGVVLIIRQLKQKKQHKANNRIE